MTERSGASPRPPDLILERYRLGELAEDEAAALDCRLQDDDELRTRLAALDRSDLEVRERYPPQILAAGVRMRLESRSAAATRTAGVRFGWRWKTVAALAVAVTLVVVVGPLLVGPGNDATDRVKGLEPTLVLYRKTTTGSERVEDGAVTHAGDQIRIGYRAAGHSWGVVVTIDGRGVVTRHLPREGSRSARLSPGPEELLDFAYELDDAPRWERFYFVAGSAPFDVGPVVEAARRVSVAGEAGPPPLLPLQMDVRQSSVLLIKQVPR